MYRATILRALFLFACLEAFANAVAASPADERSGTPVGIILDYEGTASGYELIRSHHSVPIVLFTELRTGDELEVLAETGRLSFRDSSGGVRILTRRDGRVLLNSTTRAPSVVNNAMRMIGEMITRRRELSSTELVTRGDEGLPLTLAFADMRDGSARVGEGLRNLAVAWRGGRPPFNVTITNSTGVALLSESNISVRQLLLRAPQNIDTGRYVIRVTDGGGAIITGSFVAEKHTNLDCQQDGGKGFTPPEAIFYAAKLLAEVPPRVFEAYLCLAPHYSENETARDFMDTMAAGDVP